MKPVATRRIPKVVFIGMPGSGKTRIGREVSGLLGLPFKDTDAEIETHEGCPIPRIFEERGEEEFRRIEARMVSSTLSGFDGVLSLGGGAPTDSRSRSALERYVEDGGSIVYLDVDPRDAIMRTSHAGNRPLLAGDDPAKRWRRLHAQRKSIYEGVSTLIIHTKGRSPMQVAKKVVYGLVNRTVHVGGDSPYDVMIGDGVMETLPKVLGTRPVRIALIHTELVAAHAERALSIMSSAGYEVHDITIPDAEEGKTIDVASEVWAHLGSSGFTRSDAVVGLGGGAATDVAGFIAATWMRGVQYVNCPTSLLAMVDASTGGKTGINTAEGKNLVGSFYTPRGVLADLTTLETLPNDIFVEGLGEVAKSGFIMDTQILSILEANARQLREFDPANVSDGFKSVIADLIRRTVSVKATHVSADLRESGMREFLNYGHTLGHAIEKIEHFTWRHGQAVAVGMVFAAELSRLTGHIDQSVVDYHRSLLSSLGLRTSWDGGSFDEVLDLMHRDEKARGNMLRFVILDSVGHPIHLDGPSLNAVREAFELIRH